MIYVVEIETPNDARASKEYDAPTMRTAWRAMQRDPRWENAPSLREMVRMTYAMIDAYCASYPRPPVAVTLDTDDTADVVHGHQQLALFNAHYDERCFLPIHVYETATFRPVAVLLRPGKTPSGEEVRRHLRRLVPRTRVPIRRASFAQDYSLSRCSAPGRLSRISSRARREPVNARRRLG
jgi:hypothetical protein